VLACQAVRFRVYCRERDFLPASDYRNEREHDDFDTVATHLAVVRGGTVFGTARLVPHSHRGFPLERYCAASIPDDIVATTVEVSRLAVPKSATAGHGAGRWTAVARLTSAVALQLYRSVYQIARQDGRTHLIAAMAPSLVRVLGSFDVPLAAIGPETDYGGLVRPYLISLDQFDRIGTDAARRFRRGTQTDPGARFGLHPEPALAP